MTDPATPAACLDLIWDRVARTRRTPAVLAARRVVADALEERDAAVAELARVRAGDDSVKRLADVLGIRQEELAT